MGTPKYQTGDKIGFFEIIGDTGKRNSKGSIIYKCKCICGNTVESTTTSINRVKHCGCKPNTSRCFVEGTSLPQIRPNKPLYKNNTSGCTGVVNFKNFWVAYITLRGAQKYLGLFDTYEEAVAARKAAEEKYFKPIYERYNDIMT